MATIAEDTLADEQRRRSRAGASSIVAGVLTLAGGALAASVYRSLPRVEVLDTLRERLSAHAPNPGIKALQIRWYDDHTVSLILVSILLALAAAAIGVSLSHLLRSVKARRPELSARIAYLLVTGAVLVAIAGIVQAIGISIEASGFVASKTQTTAAASDVLKSPVIVASLLLRQLGAFALGFSFIMLALNGMRVGLLTRFMGVLGIIVGVLFLGVLGLIIPLGTSLPLVQSFWLVALGALFLGRWPSGVPPAWVTGEAQPWPSQQELREAKTESRLAAEPQAPRRGVRRRPAEPPETPAPELPERRPHPSSKKRKRKRR